MRQLMNNTDETINSENHNKHHTMAIMHSNRKFIDLRELLKHKIASANIFVIPCGNTEKAVHLPASTKNY